MNELSFSYDDRRGPAFLVNLGKTLGARLQGRIVQVPAAWGTGRVVHFEPVNGFHLYAWGIQLLRPLSLAFLPSESVASRAVQLAALVTPVAAELSLTLPGLVPGASVLPPDTKLCLLSDGVFPSVTFRTGLPVRYLELSMPVEWLTRELQGRDVRTLALVNALQKTERLTLLSDRFRWDTLRAALDITELLLGKNLDTTKVRRAAEKLPAILLQSLLNTGKAK